MVIRTNFKCKMYRYVILPWGGKFRVGVEKSSFEKQVVTVQIAECKVS